MWFAHMTMKLVSDEIVADLGCQKRSKNHRNYTPPSLFKKTFEPVEPSNSLFFEAPPLSNLPKTLSDNFIYKLYYGHFFCHVLHQDYITKKGTNTEKLKDDLLDILDKRGAEYPAEHNVGHLYEAKKSLSDFYKKIDPTNSMNPGIGKTSKKKHYL